MQVSPCFRFFAFALVIVPTEDRWTRSLLSRGMTSRRLRQMLKPLQPNSRANRQACTRLDQLNHLLTKFNPTIRALQASTDCAPWPARGCQARADPIHEFAMFAFGHSRSTTSPPSPPGASASVMSKLTLLAVRSRPRVRRASPAAASTCWPPRSARSAALCGHAGALGAAPRQPGNAEFSVVEAAPGRYVKTAAA